MNTRNEWLNTGSNSISSSYYSKDETIADVVDNFNIRRYYSAEGKSVTIDGTEVQVIIQQHSNPIHQSDVDKKILIPMDTTVYTGSYVVFEDNTWIINSNVTIIDDAYKMCQMQLCNYVLKFQIDNGDILSYPCVTSGSTYSNDNNKTVNLPENQKSVLLPYDDYTSELRVDRRLYLDKRTVKPSAYRIIGDTDTTTYSYGEKGLIYFIAEISTESSNDRADLGICNYKDVVISEDNDINTGVTYSIITTNKDLLVNNSIVANAIPYESDGTENNSILLNWTITLPNGFTSDDITYTLVDNTCTINALDNYSLIGEVVLLEVSYNGEYIGSKEIIITI